MSHEATIIPYLTQILVQLSINLDNKKIGIQLALYIQHHPSDVAVRSLILYPDHDWLVVQ